MKNLIELIILTLLTFLITSQNTNAQCHIDEWNGLKALYEITDGDSKTESEQFCSQFNNSNVCIGNSGIPLKNSYNLIGNSSTKAENCICEIEDELPYFIASEGNSSNHLISTESQIISIVGQPTLQLPQNPNDNQLLILSAANYNSQILSDKDIFFQNTTFPAGTYSFSSFSKSIIILFYSAVENHWSIEDCILDKCECNLGLSIINVMSTTSNIDYTINNESQIIILENNSKVSLPPNPVAGQFLILYSEDSNNEIIFQNHFHNNGFSYAAGTYSISFFNSYFLIMIYDGFTQKWLISKGDCNYFEQNFSSNVYPGDINHDGIVNNQDDALLFLQIGNSGSPRQQQGISWQAYPSTDWGTQIPAANMVDLKHFDCDGNGNINILDNNAIVLNWGKTHDEPNQATPGIYPFGFFPSNNKIYLQPVGDINDGLLIMDIVLEHINGNDIEMFGGFFTIEYPTPTITSANVVFSSSWLGFPGSNLNMDFKDFPIQKKVEIGFSRTNNSNVNGSGIIGQVAFSINENLKQGNNAQILAFDAINVGAHNNIGEPIAISNQNQLVNIGAVNCESSITIDQSTPFQNLYKSSGTITTNNYLSIGQNQQVAYNANRVTLNSDFRVKAGADFKVRSSGCN